MKIAGCTAVVTGAASGLGRATALALHEAGARVALLDRNAEQIASLAQILGARALSCPADVTDADDVAAAIDAAAQRFGRLDVAINCAGIASSAKLVSKGDPHDLALWRKVIDVNLTGTFHVMRAAALRMQANALEPDTGARGVIVNTASIAAFDGQMGQAAYAASKSGVVGMTLPAARDLAKDGIRCVAIAPGLFETELLLDIPETGIAALNRALLWPDRMGRPEEFARLVCHIVENEYLNGCCIRLDGAARLPA